ncbi:MAG: DUF1349 domain-containing protein [Prevotella sp.]|nr:DUF1349 domain-containing protein [Prevotella sp.]
MTKLKSLLLVLLCLFMSCSEDILLQENVEKGELATLKSVTRANRKAPLYWSVYEACFVRDSHIPEDEWKENIDWVAENLRDYGYKMVAIDGWGDLDQYNEYGYRTGYSRDWEHDYEWWSNYLKDKDMELGMYFNPLWVNMAAADSGVVIKGTNIPLSNIVNLEENSRNFTWAQVDRPGAEEYVKGYIDHFAQMGTKYLRVDFLSWYETGIDKGEIVGITNRPRAHYETALRWMREECDKHGIFLSLVMPNLTNDGELEAKYGDMIRINEDCGVGGWYRFSEMDRGIKHSGWSQYRNPMDGFAYFSKISGRGKVILDGDFIRINTYDSNDNDIDEKRSVISMHLMAGGPVSITDRKSTIGKNLWLYQNREMLALNEDGFVGKPLSNDPKSKDSQIWKGQMSNGDWVIGLFNRENETQNRSIDFSSLGITGYGSVRDLWTHEELGDMKSFNIALRPHASVVIRVKASENPANIWPEPWMRSDIGKLLVDSKSSYDATTSQFSIEAAGADIEGTKDEFRYVYQELEGDVEFSAKINSVDAINAWTKAGLMIRSSLVNNSSNAMVAMTPSNGVSFQYRTTNGGGTSAKLANNIKAPVWLKVRKENDSFSAFYSTDNKNWIQIGLDQTVDISDKFYIGMAVTSHDVNQATKAVFSDVTVKKFKSTLAPWKKLDVGSVNIAGTSSFNTELKQYQIAGSGTDIEGSSDQFNFTYQQLSGNMTITAKVVGLDNTNDWAKAGLMIRSGLNVNSKNVMVAITPSSKVTFQRRSIDGWGTSATVASVQNNNVWVRIKKSGSLFTAYYSTDNSQWTQIGSSQIIFMSDKVYAGMAVTSHNGNKLCNAVFKDITIN